jgi:hypothetical protein
MTTKNVRGIKLVYINGKPTLKRVRPFRAKIKAHKADRLEKAWKGKSK